MVQGRQRRGAKMCAIVKRTLTAVCIFWQLLIIVSIIVVNCFVWTAIEGDTVGHGDEARVRSVG